MKRALGSLLLVASLGLSACADGGRVASGGDGSGPVTAGGDASRALLDAMETTLAAGSVHMDFTMAMAAGGQSFDFGGTADVDYESGRQQMTMEFPSLAPGAPAGEMEMILDGVVMYMRAPFLTQMLGAGASWIKMDLSDLGSEFGNVSGLTGQSDPSQSLGYLAGVLDAGEIGPDDVAGVPATHYRTTVDLEKAAREVPHDARAALELSLEQFRTQFGTTSFPVDVWVGEEGYVLRQRMRFDMPESTTVPGGAAMLMVVDFSDFGAKVDIRPPNASDVTDFGDLSGGFQP